MTVSTDLSGRPGTGAASAAPRARRRRRVPVAVWCAAGFLALVVLAAFAGQYLTPFPPNEQSLSDRLLPPGAGHLLGTDALGRDVLSRLVVGAQVSLTIAVVAGVLSAVIGVGVALASAYFGGRVDSFVMGWVEAQTSLPFIVLAITVASILGPSLRNLIIALVLTGWTFYARVVRAEALGVMSQEYVTAAVIAGQRHASVIGREVLPNVSGAVVVIATQEVPRLILTAAALSFLGLGVQPPTADWGNMIAEAKSYVTVAWWLAVAPGTAIVLFAVSFSTIGDWLRDVFDPRTAAVR